MHFNLSPMASVHTNPPISVFFCLHIFHAKCIETNPMVLLGFIDEPKGGKTDNDDDPSNWTISRIGGQP
ncbi:unnamed protein product, partial [Rotaria sordida]